ncbi:hypothetical protein [Yersinia pekkanenii]|uniref:Uncharacterized protein n=1 Tax=Yersinia pekkanenii TaxID=1288385 RepID=A0A0T9R0V6_9GAMM|nr:hypothetical protein [Yersinia pekkanenii]CNI37514.1 Uncharacterised protein [Yersinia pekkanenii]CRY66646.1 Uncharacterised protein [Yersinia pekkanenii]
MSKQETNSLMDTLLNAQKASAVIRALNHSWVELSGCEVELLLDMSSEYADSVTEYLINRSGESIERSPAIGDRYTKNGGGMTALIKDLTGDRIVFSYEPYHGATHNYPLSSFIHEFTLLEANHAN